MLDGLWTISFISAQYLYGSGVLVLQDSKVLGGDSGYYYFGVYTLERGMEISGEVNVVQFNKDVFSVFGNIPQFTLVFTGEISGDGNTFTMQARIKNFPEQTMKIEGVKKVSN